VLSTRRPSAMTRRNRSRSDWSGAHSSPRTKYATRRLDLKIIAPDRQRDHARLPRQIHFLTNVLAARGDASKVEVLRPRALTAKTSR